MKDVETLVLVAVVVMRTSELTVEVERTSSVDVVAARTDNAEIGRTSKYC